MSDLNQCNFIGRLGKEVSVRYMPDGKAVASFTIACGWKTKDKEGVEWIPVVAFGRLAEICRDYLAKGSQVFISGKFKTEKYEKDGVTKYNTKIIANEMQMLGSRDAGENSPAKGQPQASDFDDFNDDIPF